MQRTHTADTARLRIVSEKERLSDSERAVLSERRRWVHRYPDDLRPISPTEFNLLNEQEQANRRIDYILTLEVAYLLDQRSLPSKFVDWLKRNRPTLTDPKIFAGTGAVLAFYFQYKDQIDDLVMKLISGVLSRREGENAEQHRPLSDINPGELFAQPVTYKSEIESLVEISSTGVEILSAEEAQARLTAL